jgi:hypothetical protein
MFSKLHICYYELSEETQQELKNSIRDNFVLNRLHRQEKVDKKDIELFNEQLNELFDLNNAGIDLDIYSLML